jgi:hypothetical protein
MANVAEQFGLRPYRKLDGTPLVGAQNRYTVKAGDTTAIYQGDLVVPTSNGNIEKYDASGAPETAVIGVFNGVFYNDPTTQKPTYKNYYPGSVTPTEGNITAFVVDDPDAVFLADSSGIFARSGLFKNYGITNTTGVTQTGISKAQLDQGTSGTATTFVVQAIDISQDPDNSDTTATNGNILVRINNHFFRSGTGIA